MKIEYIFMDHYCDILNNNSIIDFKFKNKVYKAKILIKNKNKAIIDIPKLNKKILMRDLEFQGMSIGFGI